MNRLPGRKRELDRLIDEESEIDIQAVTHMCVCVKKCKLRGACGVLLAACVYLIQ